MVGRLRRVCPSRRGPPSRNVHRILLRTPVLPRRPSLRLKPPLARSLAPPRALKPPMPTCRSRRAAAPGVRAVHVRAA